MTVTVKVEGLRELQRRLIRMDAEAVAELAQGPVEGAGHIMRRAISDKAPRDTGQLAASIYVERDDELDHANVRIGPDADSFYGLFQEFGWTAPGGNRIRRQPFMRPGFEETKGAAQKHAIDGIRKGIERRWGAL